MKRNPLLYTVLGSLLLAACSPAEVVVNAEVDVEDPATGESVQRQLSNLVVELIPYDRDEIFDSLAAAAAEPEPEIPEEILAAQELTAEAQREWREREARWNTLRDTLQSLNEEIGRYNRGEARYVALFREFQDLDAELADVEREKDRAFARFDSLTKANIQSAQAYQLRYDEWANEAFADVQALMVARERESGLDMHVDTTSAQGVARFEVTPGEYWVHARFEEPYSELYWNVPITAARGEPVTLTLNRANAIERPIF